VRQPGRIVSIVLVTAYMIGAGLWLMAARRIPSRPMLQYLASLFRRKRSGTLSDMHAEIGFCWIAAMDAKVPSDAAGTSRVQLFEDGRPLGPAHAQHDEIRARGAGCYSHWGDYVYFSTSDNSDPRTNGRTYRFREV
jgi:hypothetical protein